MNLILGELRTSDGERWMDQQYVEITPNYGHSRLYYKAVSGGGFVFIGLTWLAGSAGFDDEWTDENAEVEYICRGNATFDGLRHTWWGDEGSEDEHDNGGYIYYPSSASMTLVCVALHMLEAKYCWDAENENIWDHLALMRLKME